MSVKSEEVMNEIRDMQTAMLTNTRKAISDAEEEGEPLLLTPWTTGMERLAVDETAAMSLDMAPCHECERNTYFTTARYGLTVHWCGCGEDL